MREFKTYNDIKRYAIAKSFQDYYEIGEDVVDKIYDFLSGGSNRTVSGTKTAINLSDPVAVQSIQPIQQAQSTQQVQPASSLAEMPNPNTPTTSSSQVMESIPATVKAGAYFLGILATSLLFQVSYPRSYSSGSSWGGGGSSWGGGGSNNNNNNNTNTNNNN